MTKMIKIDVKIDGLTELFNQLGSRATNREPLMRNIASIMLDAVEENFAQEGRPKWQGRKDTLAFRVSDKENIRPGWMGAKPRAKSGNKLLQKSGRLASSINEHSTNDTAAVGTNVEYAAAHNFGVTTKAHAIAPRNKKALKFGDTFAKKVNHPGSKIPKREFLKLAPDDEQEIIQAIEKHMTDGIG